MKISHPLPILALVTMVGLSSCATAPKLDDKTADVLSTMSEKLAGAKTLKVSVKRTASPGLFKGLDVAESTSGSVLVMRPNQLAAKMNSGDAPRSLVLNGNTLTLVDYSAKTHAAVAASGSIDDAVRSIHATYGFLPPVAELLVNDPQALLLEGVEQGKYMGSQTIGGVACDHMAFEQEGLMWQLWVASDDKLPRRMVHAYPSREDGESRTVTADFANWQLDPVLKASDFVAKIPAGSQEIGMIPLTD